MLSEKQNLSTGHFFFMCISGVFQIALQVQVGYNSRKDE